METPKVEPRKVVDVVTCDLCGKKARDEFSDENNWAPNQYGVDKTQITRETGESYPEGGNTKTEAFDICGDCFEAKLKPWLALQGASPRVCEVDF